MTACSKRRTRSCSSDDRFSGMDATLYLNETDVAAVLFPNPLDWQNAPSGRSLFYGEEVWMADVAVGREMPSFFIRLRKVFGCSPRMRAAPLGPSTTQPDCSRTA